MRRVFIFCTLFVLNNRIICFGQETPIRHFDGAIHYLTENKTLLAEKWISEVGAFERGKKELKNKDVEKYKEEFKEGLKFIVFDTIHSDNRFFFDQVLVDNGVDEPYNQVIRPYGDSLFTQLIKKRGLTALSPFQVTFYRPHDSFLICEVWRGPPRAIKPYVNRFGPGLIILFIFNSDGSIAKTFFKMIVR